MDRRPQKVLRVPRQKLMPGLKVLAHNELKCGSSQ